MENCDEYKIGWKYNVMYFYDWNAEGNGLVELFFFSNREKIFSIFFPVKIHENCRNYETGIIIEHAIYLFCILSQMDCNK